jgi:predicted RNA-binding protein YlqC (UPF0109 family)
MSSDMQDNINDTPMDDVVGQDNEQAPTEEEYAASQVTLRALVTTKEAGVIIGKQGKNVADLRDQTGVKAGVSKVVPGVHDRVLTVTGSLESVSKVHLFSIQKLIPGLRIDCANPSCQSHQLSSRCQSYYSRCQCPHLYPTSHLAQSHGNHHWTWWSQN